MQLTLPVICCFQVIWKDHKGKKSILILLFPEDGFRKEKMFVQIG